MMSMASRVILILVSTIVPLASLAERLQAERLERTKVDADWVLRRLMAELEANVRYIYDDAGVLKGP